MWRGVEQAAALLLSGDRELYCILAVTARMSLCSSLLALALGAPAGILLGSCRFPGRRVLVALCRALAGMPPVVCGLLFYLLFSGVGPFRRLRLLFTVPVMVLAQVVLITPLVAGTLEDYAAAVAPPALETARGLGLPRRRVFRLLLGECFSAILSAWLLAFGRAIAEVGAVSMVGGAIAWKTNVMTTAIMQYTNRGDLSMGIALGAILMGLSLVVDLAVTLLQKGVER